MTQTHAVNNTQQVKIRCDFWFELYKFSQRYYGLGGFKSFLFSSTFCIEIGKIVNHFFMLDV